MSAFAREHPADWEEALADHMASLALRASQCQHGEGSWRDCAECRADEYGVRQYERSLEK